MSSVITILEKVIPAGAVFLSASSALIGYLSLRRMRVEAIQLKQKLYKVTQSKIVEYHKEAPGFQQQVNADDVD